MSLLYLQDNLSAAFHHKKYSNTPRVCNVITKSSIASSVASYF